MMIDLLTGVGLFETLGQSEFAPLLQNFCLALLTILIPVALAIFQYGSNEDDNDYNKMVVVNRVLKLDDLLLSVLLCFFPTLLWVFFSNNWFHLLLFAIWTYGCHKLVNIFWVNFRWMRGDQEEVKIEFISSLKHSSPDFPAAWEMIWRATESLKYKEKDYLELFSKHLGELLQNSSWKQIEKLIDGFSVHVDKRTSLYLVFSKELLQVLLKIHKNSWLKAQELMGSEDTTFWATVDEVHRKTEDLINKIFTIAFNGNHSHFFMTEYQKHIELADNPDRYVESTTDTFVSVLLSDDLSKDNRYNFWNHEYPNAWKITKTGIAGTHKTIVIQVFNTYLRWLQDQLSKENTDYKVDTITADLLPEIDPMVWLPLLDFRLHSFGESRVVSMIKREWHYGLFGRIRVYNGDPESQVIAQDSQAERNRTYELIGHVQGGTFSLTRLDQYISELDIYEPLNADEKRHKDWLLVVFKEMKEYYLKLT